MIRNRRPCQHPALPPPPPSAADAAAAVPENADEEEEEEEESSRTSRSTIEKNTSASVGLFCRLHHPEVMARARMLASRGKGK